MRCSAPQPIKKSNVYKNHLVLLKCCPHLGLSLMLSSSPKYPPMGFISAGALQPLPFGEAILQKLSKVWNSRSAHANLIGLKQLNGMCSKIRALLKPDGLQAVKGYTLCSLNLNCMCAVCSSPTLVKFQRCEAENSYCEHQYCELPFGNFALTKFLV